MGQGFGEGVQIHKQCRRGVKNVVSKVINPSGLVLTLLILINYQLKVKQKVYYKNLCILRMMLFFLFYRQIHSKCLLHPLPRYFTIQ